LSECAKEDTGYSLSKLIKLENLQQLMTATAARPTFVVFVTLAGLKTTGFLIWVVLEHGKSTHWRSWRPKSSFKDI
jgi:hypothetical protein